jgi:ribosomal protein S27AE
MKVLDLDRQNLASLNGSLTIEPLDVPGARADVLERVDLTRCTRCGHSWNYVMVENVEIWNCGSCGYEARERSADFRRLWLAEREALIG